MKCKKLILHIGVHKTGTTAMQTFLYENGEALNKQGYYMPEFLYGPEHKPAILRYSIIKKEEKKTRAYLREIVERAKARSCETVIVSDEDYCKTNEVDLSHVKIFSEFFEEIEVLMYCRRPDRQSESGFAFCVMWERLKYNRSSEQWYMDNPGKDYYRHAMFYQNAIPGCEIKAVSYDFNANRLIDSFIEVCGMEATDYRRPKKDSSNISANKYMVQVMNEINRNEMSDKLFLEVKDYVLNHEQLQKGPKAIFFSDEQRRLNQGLIESKTKKFIEAFHGGEPLFDPLETMRVPEGLEEEKKKMIVDEIVNKYNLKGKKQAESILRFKKELKPHHAIATADIYREIAFACEGLGLNNTAYRFMKLAKVNRPEGPTISRKLIELKAKRNAKGDHGVGEDPRRELIARFVEQSFLNEEQANEIESCFKKKLRISKRVQTFEILREIALFCEYYNEIEAAYLFMSMAKNKKPSGKMIGNKCALYVQQLGKNKKQKRPTVYLHMGANKTASTSIQCTLASNREKLKSLEEGYLFPKAWGGNKTRSIKYLCLANDSSQKHRLKSLFSGKSSSEKSIVEFNRELLDEMIEELDGFEGQNYIFSGEDLYQFTYINMNRMRDLVELLVPNCEIQVIYVIRNYLSYMNSSTQQAAKGGSAEKEFLKKRYKKGEFFRQAIGNMRQVFGEENLNLYTFEASLQNNLGPVGFFLEQIGLQEDMIDQVEIKRKNESISNRATKMIFWMNEKTAKLNHAKYHDNMQLRKFNKRFHGISGSARYTLDKKKVEKLYPIMKKEAVWLKAEFGIDYMDFKKKEDDALVVFDQGFMQEMMALYKSIGDTKKHILYLCFLDQAKPWRQDPKSRSTFASLARWCEDNYPQITAKNYLKNKKNGHAMV